MAGAKIGFGSGSTELTEKSGFAKVTLPDLIAEPSAVGAAVMASENDSGAFTGTPFLYSPEADVDYRLRMAVDTLLDSEIFNYTAQNTGKYNMLATGYVPSFTNSAFNTNPTNVLTSGSGVQMRTYATFPVTGTGTLSIDFEGSFSGAPVANHVTEIGAFLPAAAVTGAPIDGVFLRLNTSGMVGVVSYNGTENVTSVFPIAFGSGTPYTFTANKRYQFIVYVCQREVFFWINAGAGAELVARMVTPIANSQPCASSALPFSVRQYNSGVVVSPPNFQLGSYSVRLGGADFKNQIGVNTNGYVGAYQGLSGGTLGSLQFGTVTTGSIVPPTAAVPTNTTAALGSGLGGTFYETVSLAAATDGIITSYQVPALITAAAATYTPQRRLRITGVSLASFVQTVVAGGPYVARFYIAFGHTAVSLQTPEAATTKAARRVMLPFLQLVTAAQAVSTLVAQNVYTFNFDNPIYVNPGEFVQLVTTHTGTVGTTGTVAHQVTFDYTWE
jgi:hypothetical protein